jgi:hypothetical protein
VNPWCLQQPTCCVGGRCIVRREQAPLGQTLPYRRARGDHPCPADGAEEVRRRGWLVDLGERGLGDLLLGLGLVQALVDVNGCDDLVYTGPRPGLMARCALPLKIRSTPGPHRIGTSDAKPFVAVPEQAPTWLDVLNDEHVEVHAALPMRYYLAAEQALGVRLPATDAPAPGFPAARAAQPFHVVFVGATSWAARKDYGAASFGKITAALARRSGAQWHFTLVTGRDARVEPAAATGVQLDVLSGPAAVDCLEVFAGAELVIGNDTGLTHLAALTQRPDGTGPQVIGLYGRHAHTKWTTGRDRHHAVATPFSQMLAAADRCPVRDQLDDTLWNGVASLGELPAEVIAGFAGRQAGWW